MSVPDISGKAIANLEIESLRHVAPTFHGDTLYGETTVLDKWESTSKDDRGVVHVETIGYNQDGKVVCIFRRKVMVPKNSYLEARGGEQPGRPVPQPDKNWPGPRSRGSCRRLRASERLTAARTPGPAAGCPSTSTIGTREADPQVARADQAGHHRAEQRADVVELVEPRDHRVDPRLPQRRVGLVAAGDPGGRREAQRRDHGDPAAHDQEARARPPARSGANTMTARPTQATTAPTRSTGTAPYRATSASPASRTSAAGQQVGERPPARPGADGRREDLVEVLRSPRERRGVDHVEEHHRQPDQHDRPPRHVDRACAAATGLLGAAQERRERRPPAAARRPPRSPRSAGGPSPARAPSRRSRRGSRRRGTTAGSAGRRGARARPPACWWWRRRRRARRRTPPSRP